jgi:hypothetical protein
MTPVLDPQGSPETREAPPASSEKFVELLVAISAHLCEHGAFGDSTVDEIHMIGWLAGAFEGLMADRARLARMDALIGQMQDQLRAARSDHPPVPETAGEPT